LAALVLQQAVAAVAAAFAGVILLLFLGTQILAWYWILIVCTGSFFLGLYRTLRRTPSAYQLAQEADRRLALQDSLSTAYYFSEAESKGRGSKRFQELVFERASQLCGGIAAKAAAPIRIPRSAYAATALALVALGMFSIRYLVRGSLDLRPPLMPSVVDFFRPSWLIAEFRKPAAQRTPGLPPQAGLPRDRDGARSGEPDELDPTGPGQEGAIGHGDSEESSLLEKLRDALQEMMDKLQTEDEAGQQGEKAAEDGTAAGKQTQQGKEKGKASPDGQPGEGTPKSDQQGEQTTPGETKAQAGQKSGADSSPGEDSPADGEGSGIGDSDGAKDIRQAEQLAAMGKISEIFGKRQASLTGEVMVRAPSRNEQKLATPYSESDATHAEGGGEIQRDEVPLLYQRYVQQYFEQVHKPAAAAEPARR